jgi:nitrogen-specific signal transduction histidine kinase
MTASTRDIDVAIEELVARRRAAAELIDRLTDDLDRNGSPVVQDKIARLVALVDRLDVLIKQKPFHRKGVNVRRPGLR